jgi:hypothetical protein
MSQVGGDFAITFNNAAVRTECLGCGCVFRPDTGWQVFDVNSWNLACPDCAQEHAPDLALVLPVLQELWLRREEIKNQADPTTRLANGVV